MAYRFDQYDNSLVIDGFEAGIANSPHAGISDMRNVNIVSVPGEASVGFATSKISMPTMGTGTVTSADAAADTITYNSIANVEARMAISFSASTIAGVATGTVYWLGATSSTSSQLYADPDLTTLINITSSGTGTFSFFQVASPKYFTYDPNNSAHWMVDSSGRVWTNQYTTSSGYWVFAGNNTLTNANGNGIVAFVASDNTVAGTATYIFVFRNGLIDYLKIVSAPRWVYGWKPSDGSTGNTGTVLKTPAGTNNPHEAFVAPDSRVYFCDSNYIGRWYQTAVGTAMDPTSTATYTFDQTALLPKTDLAQCLAFLGTNLLIGGKGNVIYPWDRFDTNFSYPILLAESNVSKMVTVNTNTYIFVGNRGRIYITSGSQVQLFKKVPDHISGTVEPYFTWGGACSNKNQLYFGVSATTNAGTAITQYGGVWAIDLDTEAIRLTNKLSYGTYAGYATAIMPNFGTSGSPNTAGAGLFIGWDDGASGYGIDTTTSTPYTGSQATIDSDLIPIGTYNKPRDLTKIEYRLTKPLVSGESIVIKTRLIFNTSDTGYTTTLTDSTVGDYSGISDINFLNAQWVQFQIVLNSTGTNPSYTRVREIRILGLTGPTATAARQLTL